MRAKTKCRMGNLCAVRKGDGECEKNCYYNTREVKTNADRIRSMTDEELAEFFTQYYYDGPKFYCPVQPVIGEGECAMRSDCRQCLLDWLKQEVKE